MEWLTLFLTTEANEVYCTLEIEVCGGLGEDHGQRAPAAIVYRPWSRRGTGLGAWEQAEEEIMYRD